MPNFKEAGIDHPTPKRVDVVGMILQNITRENDLVFDAFSGSGTTAVVCHNLKRRFICVEKDFNYWKTSCKRLQDHQKQGVLF